MVTRDENEKRRRRRGGGCETVHRMKTGDRGGDQMEEEEDVDCEQDDHCTSGALGVIMLLGVMGQQ